MGEGEGRVCMILTCSLHSKARKNRKEGGPPGLLRSAHLGNDWPCLPPWARERYWPIQTEKEGYKWMS